MRNIAIIPARSGSKGLKDKNIKLLSGHPLLSYSIVAAKKANIFDEIMVSTDSKQYAEIAMAYGAAVPFLRSNENSGDKADSWEVVREVLCEYQKRSLLFDSVCLLQPTSPLRTEEDIIKSYDMLKRKQANAITSVCEMDHSPLWSMTLDENASLSEFRKNMSESIPRQELEQYYRINGAIYIRKIEYAGDDIEIMSDREFAYIMERDKSIDIDEEIDFQYAQMIMSTKDKQNGTNKMD